MPTTDSGVRYDCTVAALLDMSHRAAGAEEWTIDVASVTVPVAYDPASCEHGDSVCPGCFDSWATDYIFLGPVPGVDAR